jgi:diphthamide biosynthesis methyltransferase
VLEYDSDLYRAETAGWFLDDLVRLIGAVSDGRDRAPVEILQSAIVDEGAANDVGLLDDSDPLFGPA